MTLALPEGPLRQRVLEALDKVPVDVRVLEDGADLPAGLQESGADVVLVDHEQLRTGELAELAEATQGQLDPGLAVIGEDDPISRARLLAAGASQVLSRDAGLRELGDTIETLAEVEADGGLEGPEVRGREARPRLADFLTRSPRMKCFVSIVERAVPVDTSLLVTGPTGVGKERLARAIHAEGPRAEAAFVAVNCGALPEQLLESELFGHEKGAFTGAVQRRQGHFELAAGGTIFLDEIGEMPTHLQVKLLNVLQRHEVMRLGGREPVPVDVRVIAATNRDLRAELAAGNFREDLFYRLSVLQLEIPSLAERPEDIPDLAGRFIAHFRDTMPLSSIASISPDAVDALMAYDWPGNVRELINVIERAMVLGRGREIELGDLPETIAHHHPDGGSAPESASEPTVPEAWQGLKLREVRERAVRRAEAAYLRALLGQTRGHVQKTAERAGLSPRALYDRMKRYGLRKEEFKA